MIERIRLILKTLNLSPTRLADEIEVQRSGVSHILSGRNKPSLDFVMKILSKYPEINSDWLMFGKGQMFYSGNKKEPKPVGIESKQETKKVIPPSKEIKPERAISKNEIVYDKKRTIEKIVVFYSDNTFKEFLPG